MKNIYITWYNEWKQLGKKFNWYTFNFITLELENEPFTGGVELTFVLLGFGFTLRYNYDWENSPVGKHAEEYLESIEDKK